MELQDDQNLTGMEGSEDAAEGAGLQSATAAELAAQEAEDQQGRGESQNEEELDLTQPMFAFTGEDGQEEQLTGEQILELLQSRGKLTEAEQRIQELQAKPAAAEKPVETKPAEVEGHQVEPVHWDKVGSTFASMLEGDGEFGGPENIGPALKDMQVRMILTDPHIQGAIRHVLRQELSQDREVETILGKLKEDLGGDVNDFVRTGEYDRFRQANPAYRAATPTEAFAISVAASLRKELMQFKSGKTVELSEAEKKGKTAGEKETLKTLKARGTLRPLRGTGVRPGTGTEKKTIYPAGSDEMSAEMARHITRLRQTT